MVARFGLAMVHTADAAEKITHEQIEEVMKKGFKAKLHNDLAANKEDCEVRPMACCLQA